MKFKNASEVRTAPVVATGLIGGWLTARETGVRPIGGALLTAAGIWAARSWYDKGGLPLATGLTAAYIAAFGVSHPLAKKLGAWPSVLAVTSGVAGAAHLLSDAR